MCAGGRYLRISCARKRRRIERNVCQSACDEYLIKSIVVTHNYKMFIPTKSHKRDAEKLQSLHKNKIMNTALVT